MAVVGMPPSPPPPGSTYVVSIDGTGDAWTACEAGRVCSLNAAISVAWAPEKSGQPAAIHIGAGDFVYDCRYPQAPHSNGRDICVVLDEATHASDIRLIGEPGLTTIRTNPEHNTLFDVREGGPKLKVEGITFKAPLKLSGGDLRLTDCAFEDSYHGADSGGDDDGGALHVSNELSVLNVDNTRFESCRAQDGGAVYIEAGSADFSNCVFAECVADGLGGAIYVGGTAKVALRSGTSLYDNTASDPTFSVQRTRLESIHIASEEERAVVYQLPAPLGHYIDSFGQPELALKSHTEGGWYHDFPTKCAAGFYGADDALGSQSSTVCCG